VAVAAAMACELYEGGDWLQQQAVLVHSHLVQSWRRASGRRQRNMVWEDDDGILR
jgi:hypothetical protein